MSHPLDATAANPPPADTAAKPAGWKLVEDAPAPDLPSPRDRAGAARGLTIILLGGGFFWAAIAAAIWFATHRGSF